MDIHKTDLKDRQWSNMEAESCGDSTLLHFQGSRPSHQGD